MPGHTKPTTWCPSLRDSHSKRDVRICSLFPCMCDATTGSPFCAFTHFSTRQQDVESVAGDTKYTHISRSAHEQSVGPEGQSCRRSEWEAGNTHRNLEIGANMRRDPEERGIASDHALGSLSPHRESGFDSHRETHESCCTRRADSAASISLSRRRPPLLPSPTPPPFLLQAVLAVRASVTHMHSRTEDSTTTRRGAEFEVTS